MASTTSTAPASAASAASSPVAAAPTAGAAPSSTTATTTEAVPASAAGPEPSVAPNATTAGTDAPSAPMSSTTADTAAHAESSDAKVVAESAEETAAASQPPAAAATTSASTPADSKNGPVARTATGPPVAGGSTPAAAATTTTTTTSAAAAAPTTSGGAAASAPSEAKGASSSLADEKAAAAAGSSTSRAVTKPASKRRRKRTGLAAIFVALGCLSSDDFEDDAPNKAAPPVHAAKTTAAAGSGTGGAAGASSGTAASKSAAAAAAGVGAAAVAAGVAGASASKEKDASIAPKDGSATPGAAGDVLVPSSEPTTAPLEETAGLTSGAVQAPGSGSEILHQHQQHTQHRNDSEHHLAHAEANRSTDSAGYTDLSESDGGDVGDQTELLYGEEEYEDEEDRLIAQGGIGIPLDENGNPAPLLPPIRDIDAGRKCLVLDLDETLLHSSFKMLPSADYIVPVEIESQTHNVYVIKRPGVDHFLAEMGKIYEIVVFTASLSKYADPVLDMLDVGRVVRHRLFRESCYNHKGNYVKDLSQLGRHISTSIIIDNSPASYIFHPNNAVPVSTWFNDPHDTELTDLCPFLADLATVDDVRGVLDGSI